MAVLSALGFLETHGLTPAMVAMDAMTKAAQVQIVQVELNDLYGVCVQLAGSIADVQAAVAVGAEVAGAMAGNPVTHIIPRPERTAGPGFRSRPEYNPLIQQNVVFAGASDHPMAAAAAATSHPHLETSPMSNPRPSALGFIETQGFTAVMEALDTACKAADVAVVGKEKLGGGYITVVIQGELSAVTAAVEAGRGKVEGLGKLIAAHVIARPSEAVLSLTPRL